MFDPPSEPFDDDSIVPDPGDFSEGSDKSGDLKFEGEYDTMQERSYYDPETVLEAAITKAIAGGWRPFGDARITIVATVIQVLDSIADMGDLTIFETWRLVIFNHDFARCLWGEPKVIDLGPANADGTMHGIDSDLRTGWKYHLQMMVVDPDPIAYLGKNI